MEKESGKMVILLVCPLHPHLDLKKHAVRIFAGAFACVHCSHVILGTYETIGCCHACIQCKSGGIVPKCNAGM